MTTAIGAEIPGSVSDFHGYGCYQFDVDGHDARIAVPSRPLPGRPWMWRTMFWDAFPSADIALLERGFYIAYVDAGDTFASPDALKLFDAFYELLTAKYGFSKKPALEGLSRGGYCAYRWAYFNTDKVGCIYGDAPLCDIGVLRRRVNDRSEISSLWRKVIASYGLPDDAEASAIEGNPIDSLDRLAVAHIPILHVCGDIDEAAVNADNNDIVQERYPRLGGEFTLIMKRNCPHHPHGLSDPTLVADYIVARCAEGPASVEARKRAPKAGEVVFIPEGKW
jgi:hypothetical protein